MPKFYDPNGESVSEEEFIEIYSDTYFKGNMRVVKGVKQSSYYVELEMEKLLKSGIRCENDVMRILGWKTGKINQANCKEGFPLVYYKGWEDVEHFNVRLYDHMLKMEDFCIYLVENFDCLKRESMICPQNVLNTLRDKAPIGIGTIYLLTFLYFISGGYWPIFDTFADKALSMICSDYKTVYKKIPSKNDPKFDNVIENYISIFWRAINNIFGLEKYRESRNIDRALWVYGHKYNNCN